MNELSRGSIINHAAYDWLLNIILVIKIEGKKCIPGVFTEKCPCCIDLSNIYINIYIYIRIVSLKSILYFIIIATVGHKYA